MFVIQSAIKFKIMANKNVSQAYQGQFTLPLAYQGISKYAWQTVGTNNLSHGPAAS